MKSRLLSVSERHVYNPARTAQEWVESNLYREGDEEKTVEPIVECGWLAGLEHIAHKIPPYDWHSVLLLAAGSGYTRIMRLAWKKGACVRTLAIHNAAANNHCGAMKLLRKWWRVESTCISKSLHGCQSGHLFDTAEDGILCGAVAAGDRKLVEWAIKQGGRPRMHDSGFLCNAIAGGGDIRILLRVLELLEKARKKEGLQNLPLDFANRLLWWSTHLGAPDIMRVAKILGATNRERVLASHIWTEETMPRVKLILSWDINIDDLLRYAANEDHHNHIAVQYALEHGATYLGFSVLGYAAAIGDICLMRRCRVYIMDHSRGTVGETTLIAEYAHAALRAINHKQVETVRELMIVGPHNITADDILDILLDRHLFATETIILTILDLGVTIYDDRLLNYAAWRGYVNVLRRIIGRARLARHTIINASHIAHKNRHPEFGELCCRWAQDAL